MTEIPSENASALTPIGGDRVGDGMTETWCTVCRSSPVVARDRCMTCYQYRRRNGVDRPEGKARRQAALNYRADQRRQERLRIEGDRRVERFMAKVDRADDGCWLWTGFVMVNGYGRCNMRSVSSSALAHRVAYELFVGPIPDGLTLDHTCRVRRCVNPMHLEVVTLAENLRRGRAAKMASQGR